MGLSGRSAAPSLDSCEFLRDAGPQLRCEVDDSTFPDLRTPWLQAQRPCVQVHLPSSQRQHLTTEPPSHTCTRSAPQLRGLGNASLTAWNYAGSKKPLCGALGFNILIEGTFASFPCPWAGLKAFLSVASSILIVPLALPMPFRLTTYPVIAAASMSANLIPWKCRSRRARRWPASRRFRVP
jgi:hypothetical protein